VNYCGNKVEDLAEDEIDDYYIAKETQSTTSVNFKSSLSPDEEICKAEDKAAGTCKNSAKQEL